MYSLKLTDTAPRAPITTGTTMTFRMRQTFSVSCFNSWYFCNFSSSLSFTLSSPGMAKSIMTTSLSLLSVKTMSGLLASIFRSHLTVKSHSIFPPLPLASVHTSYYLFPIHIHHIVASGYTVTRYNNNNNNNNNNNSNNNNNIYLYRANSTIQFSIAPYN